MTPEQFQMLADAKLTVEQIGVVMKIMAQAGADMKAAEEARKASARERVQRWRDKQKDGVTLQKRNRDATERLTRGLDITSNLEISGQEERKDDASPSARPIKATRIPDDFAPDEAWASAHGLTPQQASVEAAQFLDYWRGKSGKDGTKQDWPATWRVWVRNAVKRLPTARSGAPPNRRRNIVDAAVDQLSGQANGTESVFGNHGNVELLPARGGESGSDAAHLRGGIGRRIYAGSG